MAISIIIIVLVTVGVARKDMLFLNLPAFWFYPIAVLLGPLCIIFEYLLNGFYLYLRKGIFPRGFSIHPFWMGSNVPAIPILMLFIVAGEELIFRQLMFSILIGQFQFSLLQTLLVTSLIYGVNHLYFGFHSASTKFFTGVIYGSLYYLSGLSIFVPIIVHYVQNITLLRFQRIGATYVKST